MTYKIEILGASEIRMGSPFNTAVVKITGGWAPKHFDQLTSSDVSAIDATGDFVFIGHWENENNEPGFSILKLSDAEKSITTSQRFEGCLKQIEVLSPSKIKVLYWNLTDGDKESEVSEWTPYKNKYLED